MKIFRLILVYLKDWRNWLTHGIIGIVLLLLAIYLPVKPVYKIIALVLVIAFNILRMNFKKKSTTKE